MQRHLAVLLLACLAVAVADSPLLRLLTHLPSRLPHADCRHALVYYLQSLHRSDAWAVSMYDASTKYPDGVLATNGYSLGHFDECLFSTSAAEISGKYCLINARYSKINSTHPMLPVSRFKFNRNEAHFAICLPSVCTAETIETAIQQSLHLFPVLRNFHVQVSLNEQHCTTLKTPQTDDDGSSCWLWFSVLLAAAIYLTSLLRRAPQTVSLLSCFSVSKHWRRLFQRHPDSISCIHGLRVVALSLVIIGHRAEAIAAGPLVNPESIEKLFESCFNVFMLNGTVIVDTFFTISGFLLAWNILKFDQNKLTWWRIVGLRYLRLAPCYAIVIAVQALVMENLNSGPLWMVKVGKEAANCRKNWWANLLFVNNYWDPQHICLDPSWYLACDMQFLVLGTLVVLPLSRWRRFKFVPLAVASVLSLIVPFFVTYYFNLDPTVIPDPSTVGKTSENPTNLLLYITGYCRAGPYLIGIATAYFLNEFLKTQKTVDDSFWSLGWYFCAFCTIGSVVVGWPFFTTAKIDPLLRALYAATFRSVFSMGIAFIIVYGVCRKEVPFLSAEPLNLLSKVTYSVYLTHTLWIQLSYAWIRGPLYSSDLLQTSLVLSDLIICTFVGILFHVLIEAPVSEIFYKPHIDKLK